MQLGDELRYQSGVRYEEALKYSKHHGISYLDACEELALKRGG